ncbi:MAG TPA: DUF2339 domain-containing protein, partial [Gemmataceae bacterium]|nr:DUF2339 domain-containing protein [Gemmataceae bacterium]
MLFLLCIAALGFALWNRASIRRLDESLSELRFQFAAESRATASLPKKQPQASPTSAQPPAVAQTVATEPPTDEQPQEVAPELPHAPDRPLISGISLTMVRPGRKPQSASQSEEPQTASDLERQFGARLPVWVGAVALALAGFFLVRYTIEIGLLTETVRVTLGGIFGFVLLGAGHWARRSNTLANGTRIAQALSGAGIADLYASLFVAATLYHLISPATGFVGMAGVTAGAVALSLRYGAPIAILGLIGGFLTPAMTGASEPNVPLLFGYLYCLFAGLLAIFRKQGWWHLATPMVLAAFVWVPITVERSFDPQDSLWPLLYVMAIGATVVVAVNRASRDGHDNELGIGPIQMLRYIALGGSIILSGFVSGVGGFGPIDWSLFGLLSAGGIVLAALQPRVYSFVPIVVL